MSDLFRPEAIEHRRHRLYGEVVLSMPLTHWTVTAVIAAAFHLSSASAGKSLGKRACKLCDQTID